jgi:hypothetical protein
MAQMTPLRRRMIGDMTVRNLSPATQQSYVYAVAKFSRFFGCSPDLLGIEEVRAYQLHLAGLGWSWSHINQVSCALRFFFGVTLADPRAFDRIISAKEPKRLPVGLCQLSRLLIDDVSAILPRAQAVSRMPSAIAALRMCCQRRVAAGTRWRMRDLQRRKFRSSSWPRQYRLADPVLFNPSIGRHRPLMPR